METETKGKEIVKPNHEGKALILSTDYTHGMEPRNFGELQELAKLLADSDIVPKDLQKKPANVLVVLMFGREVGLTTSQSMQNVMVVNGRPSMWGDAVMGLVEHSGQVEFWTDNFDDKTMTSTFTIKRKGSREPVTRTFSQADAQKAGLWTKQGPWALYPKVMLFNRARAFALRHTFSDVLKGLRIYEEERDIIDVTPVSDAERQPIEPPKAKAPPVQGPEKQNKKKAQEAKAEPSKPAGEGQKPEAVWPESSTVKIRVSRLAKTTGEGKDIGVVRDDKDVKYLIDLGMEADIEKIRKSKADGAEIEVEVLTEGEDKFIVKVV